MKLLAQSRTAALALLVLASSVGAQEKVDRTKKPAAGPAVGLRMPKIERRTLSNGIDVAVLENHELPIVSVQVVVEARGVLDPGDKDGLAAILNQMLSEGTTSMNADQLAEAFADLGNTVFPTFFSTIAPNFDRSLELMTDMLIRPALPQASLDRIKANEITNLKRQQDQPAYIASRVYNNAVFGHGHPYERVRTEQSLNAITRQDLLDFHGTYYRPQNVKVVVAGDVTPGAAVAALEKTFGKWPKGGKLSVYNIPAAKGPGETKIYLFDRPNSPQSVIRIGQLGPRRDTPDYYALDLLNTMLGGMFNSRINLNLRERRAFSYGAGSFFGYRRVPEVGNFDAGGSVVTAKTDSSVMELMRELREIRDSRPPTQAELDFARAQRTLSLPQRFETLDALAGNVASILRDNLPLNYYDQYSANMAKVTVSDVVAVARKYLDPDRVAIIIVGDRKQIEPGLRAANIAPIVIVDEMARPVTAP